MALFSFSNCFHISAVTRFIHEHRFICWCLLRGSAVANAVAPGRKDLKDPCGCVGSLQVLPLPPTLQSHAR